MINIINKELNKYKNIESIKHNEKYFQTFKGGYGYGDKFFGIPSVLIVRQISKKYKNIDLNDILLLLNSEYHEKRLLALFILIEQYNKKNSDKKSIIDFYIQNIENVNNWDLVDMSCYKLLGDYLYNYKNRNYDILLKFNNSKNMWKRRISIVSTMYFIKQNFFEPTLIISKKLLQNEHHLINKAVGWMLREIWKRNNKIIESFLVENIKNISPITFSYATEKMNIEKKNELKKMK